MTDAAADPPAAADSPPQPLRWPSVPEAQICVMVALERQLARVNRLLETSFGELSAQFVQLAADMHAYRTLGQAAASPEQAAIGERIDRTLKHGITSMQFQDRVSQNLVITMDVLREIAAALAAQRASVHPSAPIDHEAARELYYFLRLGEIREAYLNALVDRAFAQGPGCLGISLPPLPQAAASSGDAAVELF